MLAVDDLSDEDPQAACFGPGPEKKKVVELCNSVENGGNSDQRNE